MEFAGDRDTWRGTLILIAQPAEERGAGVIGYTRGYAMANVDSVDINVRGMGGHDAYPHKTKDPVVLAAQLILQLQTITSREISPLESAVITVGPIHGGSKHNVIGNPVRLQLTARSYSDETREYLLHRIREISLGLARTAGLPEDLLPEVRVKDEHTPSVYNDPGLVDRVVSVLSAELGDSGVQAVPPVMAGEDFARYGRTEPPIPSMLFWLGMIDPDRYSAAMNKGETPALHSPLFAPLP